MTANNIIDIRVALSGAKQVESGLKGMLGNTKSALGGFLKMGLYVGGGLVAAFGAALAASTKFGEQVGTYDQLATGFKRNFGNMEKSLKTLQKASKGTISDFDLMQTANRAALLGITKDSGKLAQLMQTASLRGKEMGITTTQAFNDIVTGIGRGSAMILDNLGIVIPSALTKTMETMTDTQKKQALLNFAIKDGQQIAKQYGKQQLTSAEISARFTAQMDNLGMRLLKLVQPAMDALLTTTSGWLTKIEGVMPAIEDLIGGLIHFSETGEITNDLLLNFSEKIGMTRDQFHQLTGAISTVHGWFTTKLLPALSAIGSILLPIISEYLPKLGAAVSSVFKAIVNDPNIKAFINTLKNIINFIGDAISKLADLDAAQRGLSESEKRNEEVQKKLSDKKAFLSAELAKKGFKGTLYKASPEKMGQLAKQYGVNLTGKAVGGAVQRGRSYLVGERQPEVFTPSVSGSIGQTGNTSGGNTFNIYQLPGEKVDQLVNAISFKLKYI